MEEKTEEYTLMQWMDKKMGGDANLLSNLRPKWAQSVARYKDIMRHIANVGICFSINPTDQSNQKLGESGIKGIVQRAFDRFSAMYMLIPEYNTKRHQLHYHGCCIVRDYEILNKIKRSITRQVGRCETESIADVEAWIDYCFKCYNFETDEQVSTTFTRWHPDHVIYPKGLIIRDTDKI